MSRKIAVYSTYCGSSESKTFHEIPASPKYPYFFISNNPSILARAAELGWTPISLEVQVSADPVVSATQAKIAKVIPHTFPQLAEYDFLFYADDKIYVDPERIGGLIDALTAADSPLALRKHPFLPPNVLYEFGEAMLQPRYKSEWEKTVKYICDQVNAGAKLECETLYTTNAILRNMRHPDVVALNEEWYQHVLRCGIECQISFHFIAQKYKNVTLLPSDIGEVAVEHFPPRRSLAGIIKRLRRILR